MPKLVVLLSNNDSSVLNRESIRLQRAFLDSGNVFQINYQSGSFSQFFVEVNCCAEHFEKALRKSGFKVEVRDDELQATTKEHCHDCQTILATQ